ncbi:MAG: RIP metalloprotease RseP [Thermoanaerobaculia bacterium]
MLNLLSNTAAFVFALGVIIFVHEAGHLLVAKVFDVRVLAFSLGFGRRLWGFRRGETDYRVSLVPLGGYVRLGGEDPAEVDPGDPQQFLNKPRWQRVLVYLAGPAMNVVLAIVLIAGVFMVGVEVSAIPDLPPVVGHVVADSAAAAVGIEVGDRILAVDGKAVRRWDEVQFALLTSPERPVALVLERAGQQLAVTVTPAKVPRYEFGDAGLLPKQLPKIAAVVAGSPAERAGFAPGDEIHGVDGRAIGSGNDFVEYVEQRPGQSLTVEVERQGRSVVLTVVPRLDGEVGRIGVTLSYFQRFGPLESFVQSARFNWQITVQTFRMLGKIATGQVTAKSAFSGPLEIAALSGAAVRSGLRNLIQLMGLISISIAILNLLPVPVLDGGQITILLVESGLRRDFPFKVKERIQQVGFVLIVMLMVMVLYFDISKNVPPGLLPGS